MHTAKRSLRTYLKNYSLCTVIALTSITLSLSACSSLPRIHPDMALKSDKQIQLEGKQGPLSVAKSKEILEKLGKKSEGTTNIFDKHLAVEESITGTPLVLGNQVDLLIDGEETYAAMFKAIREAKDHINMETFIIEDDDTGRAFADALIERQLNGVQVNLIYDSFGALNTPRAFFDRLTANGVKVLEFNPINIAEAPEFWKFNQRDHRKLLIVDGKVAFVGGVNISSVYSVGSSSGSFVSNTKDKISDKKTITVPWRDTHLRLEGPVVNDFQKLFLQTWENQKGEALVSRNYLPKLEKAGNQVVRAIGSSPQDEFSLIYVTLLSAINSAETHVYLTNAYFVPDPQLLEALKNAAGRGVDVKLLLPSKTDSNLVYYASRSFYTELLTAGVKIYEEQQSLLHAKTALIDGVWSTIGSTNLDWRSFLHNYEINAVILSNSFGDQMYALFQRDLKTSELITIEQWKKRPLSSRIRERAARIWAYWL
jgi:cardiolipin synthase A/B